MWLAIGMPLNENPSFLVTSNSTPGTFKPILNNEPSKQQQQLIPS
jgi:hypothetical protein